MTVIKQKVLDLLAENENLSTSAMAQQLAISELEVLQNLPSEMVAFASGEQAKSILEEIATYGKVTTIVHSFGSIFEVKAAFPVGKMGHGYYNLMGDDEQLQGHLLLDAIEHIALVSKPLRGKESHYFGFLNAQGEHVFKVYLGRDKKRVLLADQVEKFKQKQAELRLTRTEVNCN